MMHIQIYIMVLLFLGSFLDLVYINVGSNRVVPTSQPAQSKVVKSKPKYSKLVVPLSDTVLRKKH